MPSTHVTEKNRNQEDIMSVLMELEKPTAKVPVQVDSSDDESAARGLLDQLAPAASSLKPQLDYSTIIDILFS